MLNIHKLPPDMADKLGYYIYLYIDPDTNRPFYVGKGKGNRAYDHLADTGESEKARFIRELREKEKEPLIEILIHGLPDEDTAYRVECAAIDLIGIHNLTNAQRGRRSGLYGRMPLKELISIYEHPQVTITEPAILIRINQLFHYGMSDFELYEATRGLWKVGEQREKAEYAFAIYDGIVREVYRIRGWYPGGTTKYLTRSRAHIQRSDRWEFVGNIAEAAIRDKYLLKAVDKQFKLGSQNPILYVNCDKSKGKPHGNICIDADPYNADWTKQSWDLPPYKSSEFMELIKDEKGLEDFKKLPVYHFAVRQGIIVDDEWVGPK